MLVASARVGQRVFYPTRPISTSLPAGRLRSALLPLADAPNRNALTSSRLPPGFVTPVEACSASTTYEGLRSSRAVVVRLAVVIPLKPIVMLSVRMSAMRWSKEARRLLLAAAVTVPFAVSESEPPPVQPLTVNVLPLLVAARLAVVMPMRPSAMPSVEDREVLVRVKHGCFLLAATVSEVAALSVSDPLPVQPLTVKVLPPVVSVKLAVVNPFKVSVAPLVTATEVLARATLFDTLFTKVSEVPLSVPLPVQPVTMKLLPPVPLSVRLAVANPVKPSDSIGCRRLRRARCWTA